MADARSRRNHRPPQIEIGKRYGQLTAIGGPERRKNGGYWHFRCACGTEKWIHGGSVKYGNTRSCGCLYKRAGLKRSNAVLTPGARYGRLTVVERAGNASVGAFGNLKALWLFRCDCGNDHITQASSVRSGNTKSCGCLKSEVLAKRARERNLRHGMAGSPEYLSWHAMKRRCNNPKDPHYHRYGGRGITFCEPWNEFAQFFSDMGRRPSLRHTLHRIDNDKGYYPENCCWATPMEQCRNKGNNRFVETPWGRMIVAEAARMIGIDRATLRARILAGWPAEMLFNSAGRPKR